jgi:hypothetical protein
VSKIRDFPQTSRVYQAFHKIFALLLQLIPPGISLKVRPVTLFSII